ncbi:MAG: Holliday junction branch migration protein RuvA [Parabacteroides sp.]|nr:Holliday junction branch migration protein RuvA [Parabacteroides distasonis]MCI7009260.1 Holliday junction branch migration protein RuvA [Parabacteroides sp.]MCI7783330.1 Holliday junction branch migration protein RuvA [Parabacteroides sp.]MDY4756541.1 Holliday junction branch migration protein RuvA [Parabacteroides sp.]
MIEYIKGEIVELTPARMILECGGIGYELNISLTTYSAFNGKQTGKLFVYEVIREDAHLLFGFAERMERELFLLLTSVSGVGPNTARMILSSLPPKELVETIASKNEAVLTAVKGIGSKTAQRILVDLKNKVKSVEGLTPVDVVAAPSNGAVAEEAVAALVMLGFQKAASQKAVTSILKGSPAMAVEQVVKTALRML